MKLKITKTFPFAHGGRNVVTYEKGQVIDTNDEELIAVALKEGWATRTKAVASDEPPENKADTPALETKANAEQ